MSTRLPRLHPLTLFLVLALAAGLATATEPAFQDTFARNPLAADAPRWVWDGAAWERRDGKVGIAHWRQEDGEAWIEVGYGMWRGPFVDLEPGALYRFACRSRAAHKGYWGVLSYDADGAEIPASPYSMIPESATWTDTEAVVQIPDTATTSRVLLWPRDEPILVDDLVLERIDRDRARAILDREYAAVPPIDYHPGADRWQALPHTHARLAAGKQLRVLLLGDSVANDLGHSQFHLLVERAHGHTRVDLWNKVGSGARARDYLGDDAPLTALLARYRPDLVIFGGMSSRAEDLPDLRRMAARVRASGERDFLALSATIMLPRYWDDLQRSLERRHPFRDGLRAAAEDDGFAAFDIGAAWERYVQTCDRPLAWFRRDHHHANQRGKQVYGRLLAAYLAPVTAAAE